MQWSYFYYNDTVQAEIEGLSPVHLARLAHIRELIEIDGPNLGHPHTDSFGDGLFEMRLKGPETIARVCFCFFTGKRIVFLHVFIKKTRKTPAKEIALARQRFKELKQREIAEQEAKQRHEGR